MSTIIEINHLKKSFGDNEVLKDIQTTVNKSEVLTIIGSSGSGKSTLLRCINLLEKPTSGEILYNGENVLQKGYNLSNYRTKLGMVFQSFNLFNNLNVLENCTTGQITVLKRHPEEAKKIALENLDKVGLKEFQSAKPSQLSGGQKQRVAIARALANDPKILISDESTSALDPKTTKQILALLQELNEKLGLTIVLITHEMQIVKDIANRVAVMQDGRLIEEGSVLEIFSHPKQELTKDFIKTATGIDEALVKIYQQGIVKELPDNSVLVQLKYSGASTDTAIVNDLYKFYQVSSNILYGNIEILDHIPVGELVVILSGEQANIQRALTAVREANVEVNILKGDLA